VNLSTTVSETKEIFVDGGKFTVTVNTWANLQGCSLMVHGNSENMPMRMAGSFRWEEIDAIIVALAAARAV